MAFVSDYSTCAKGTFKKLLLPNQQFALKYLESTGSANMLPSIE